MPEVSAQYDDIDVERIMDEVRARVAAQAREAEQARLAKRADEAERARGAQTPADAAPAADGRAGRAAAVLRPSESFAFDGNSIYWSSRGGVGLMLYGVRRLLRPLVKFVFNVDPMVHALVTQARLNAQQAAFDDEMARRLAAREEQDARNRRAVRDLAGDVKRLSAEMKDHRTLAESLAARLDAIERARTGDDATPPRGGHPDGRAGDDAPPAAEPPGQSGGRADEGADDDPAPPPAAGTPPPNR